MCSSSRFVRSMLALAAGTILALAVVPSPLAAQARNCVRTCPRAQRDAEGCCPAPVRPSAPHPSAPSAARAPAAATVPAASTGYVQPSEWAYSRQGGGGWQQLWSGEITLAAPAVLMVSLQAHWRVDNNWCYATVTVDGVPLADRTCDATNTHCWGAAHTYTTQWHPLSYTASTSVEPGRHTLGVSIVALAGTTCFVNGARIFWTAIP